MNLKRKMKWIRFKKKIGDKRFKKKHEKAERRRYKECWEGHVKYNDGTINENGFCRPDGVYCMEYIYNNKCHKCPYYSDAKKEAQK